ncbi:MAG: hypothetical protein U0939_22535 [Pirellulales bacterium]
MTKGNKTSANRSSAPLGFEKKLWATADKYADIAGFCKSASRVEIESHGHVLTPGRYVGAEETEDGDDMPFEERIEQLTAKLKGQFAESAKLEKAVLKNLTSLGFTGKESS